MEKFTLTTTTQAVDLVSSMLDDIGIEGVEIEDNVRSRSGRPRECSSTFCRSCRRTRAWQR